MAAVTTLIQDYCFLQAVEELGGEVTITGLNEKQFVDLSATFPELRTEKEVNGNITIKLPFCGGNGMRISKINGRIGMWCQKYNAGHIFSPNTGIRLADGSIRCSSTTYISHAKLAKIELKQLEEDFIPLVPDFIGEIRSKSDSLKKLKEKMQETWIANGVQLAWLIDPYKEKAYVYRANGSIDVIEDFDQKLSGENVLKDFELDLNEFRLLSK